MQTVKQIIILALIGLAFLAAAFFLSGWLAERSLGTTRYFDRDKFDIRNTWVSMNYFWYLVVGFVAYWAFFPWLLWCRRNKNTEFIEVKKRYKFAIPFAIILNLLVIGLGGVLCNYLHPVQRTSVMVLNHVLYLSPVFAVLMIALLLLFIIRPIADKISF